MARGRSRWPPGWLLCAVLAMACGDSADGSAPEASAYVLDLSASAAGGLEGRGQSAWARDVVAGGLSKARWFRAEGEGPTLSARIRYEERRTEEGVPVLRAHLVVEPDPALAERLEAAGLVLDAYVELERRDQTIELRRDLPFLVERGIALLDAKVTVVRGSIDDMRSLLREDDPEVLGVALAAIQRARVRELGDEVFALLDHEDESVALAAVECLGVIGGPEHTPGLLRAVRLADRAQANRLYDALGNLGGEHARGFLAFAARNEEDPELALLAERALARLEATEGHDGARHSMTRGHRQ